MLLPYGVLEKTHAQADGPAQLNGQLSTCLGMGRAVSKAEVGRSRPLDSSAGSSMLLPMPGSVSKYILSETL